RVQRRQGAGERADLLEGAEVEAQSGRVPAQTLGGLGDAPASGDDGVPAVLSQDRPRRMESQASGSSEDQRRAPRFHGRPSVSMRAGGFTLRVRGAHFFDGYQTSNGAAAFRNSVGLTPRWRLKAVLKPNASAYPTDRATWATVDSRSARSSSARSMRHSVRYRNGDSPMTSLKRLA